MVPGGLARPGTRADVGSQHASESHAARTPVTREIHLHPRAAGAGMSSHAPRALVVSGHTMALAVVRALGEAGVPVGVLHYDARDMAQASRYVVEDGRVPHPLHDEERFVGELMQRAPGYERPLLVPASDESLVALSRHADALSSGYVVACAAWDVVRRVIDKSCTYEVAERSGVAAPRTRVPRSGADLEVQAAEIGFPLLLKPAESHRFYERFGRKMVRVETLAALHAAYAAAVDAGLSVMVQEIIPGPDDLVVNYNAYTWDGVPRAEFTARQVRKAPPQFGSPRVVLAERIPGVIEPGRRILAALGFSGFACTEFKLDPRTGSYVLMEVNGRHNLSGLLAVRSGVNFPLLQYRHLMEGVLPNAPSSPRYGLYWTDAFRDVGYNVAGLRRERYGAAEYLRPYAARHCDAILDRRDPGPSLVRLLYLARHLRVLARSAGRS